MTDAAPIWISEAEVVSMMDMGEAIEALEKGLAAEAEGNAQNMIKTHVAWGKASNLHAMGAVFAKAGYVGTKTWAHTPEGAAPVLVLYNSASGALKAVIEAYALGQLRTGAASGVATRWLAGPNAAELAIIGTGRHALAQVGAVAAVRPIKRVRIFGPSQPHRELFALRVQNEFDLEVLAARSVAEAIEGASVITVVTRATEPVVSARMIARGAHINAVGAIVRTSAEINGDVLARCDRVITDSVPSAQRLARELIDYFGPEERDWGPVQSLAQLLSNRASRRVGEDITLFKSLGVGISDLALGIALYERARRLDLGRRLPEQKRVAPRLRKS